MEEPYSPAPRACSTPHSAPAAWLHHNPEAPEPEPLTPEDQRRQDIDDFLSAYERIAPEAERRDGWSPFLRKLFLQTLAETGQVTIACEYTGMSRSSAYALRARDRVFAAGMEAARHFGRDRIADELCDKAMNGITETVTRADGTTVTRHRFDTRLSIAVLNRLDKRCDRAEEQGAIHLAAVRNWDEYLRLVGRGDQQAAEALLDGPRPRRAEGAKDCPSCPLPERAFPIPLPDPPGFDVLDNVWKDEDGRWLTSFPPPPGFDGWRSAEWDGFNAYQRVCTPEEAELIDAGTAAAEAGEMAEITASAEAERDKFFEELRAHVRAIGQAGVRPAPWSAALATDSAGACGEPPEQAQSALPS